MRVLIAEDDDDVAEFIERGLSELGHVTTRVASGVDALHIGSVEVFDVAILDRMLPALDGVEIIKRWRVADVAMPVLMLTALGGIADRVSGLNAGADDYLVKPFAFSELEARLTALGRRPAIREPQTRFTIGDVTLDLVDRSVRRGNRDIALQPREFSLLEQLMRHAGRVVTRTMFLETIWGYHFDPKTNIVDSHMSRMRTKLNHGVASDPIETLRGIGYRMRGDA